MLDYIQNNIFTAIPTTTFSVEISFAHKSTMADNSNPTATNNELEPLEFLSKIRETLKGRISDDDSEDEKVHNIDIEQNIREIRALLAINDEISKRCMTNVKSAGDKTTLTLFGFYSVRTMQNGTNLELITQPQRVEETFDTLLFTTLPSGLEDTIVPKYKEDTPFQAFIDYDDFFESVLMLLHDDALELFLPKIKDHLEAMQVALGQIDEWAMQTTSNLSFIEETFGKELVIPDDIDSNDLSNKCFYCNCRVSTYPSRSECSFEMCKTKETLTECTVSGKYDTVFYLSQDDERERLKRFMYFVWG